MNRQLTVTEAVWLNDSAYCRIEHLAEVSGLTVGDIEDLVDSGVIAPAETPLAPDADTDKQTRYFQLHYVVTVKTARRLRDDFQLDRPGLALALTLLGRIEALEAQLRALG